MTNFDLSTYIRWLRPGGDNSVYQGLLPENPILQSESSFLNLNKEPDISNHSSFAIKNPAISEKREIIERKMPLSSCNKGSSPTALGLLLQSSLFKELVEKTTTTASSADNEENDDKPPLELSGQDDELLFYTRTDLEVVAEDKGEMLPEIKNASPLYNRTGRAFWDGMKYGR